MLRTLGERLDRSKLITGLVRRAEDKDSGPPRPPTLPFNFPLPRHCLRFSVGDPKLSDPPSLYVPPRPFLSCPHPAHRNAQTPAPGPAPTAACPSARHIPSPRGFSARVYSRAQQRQTST